MALDSAIDLLTTLQPDDSPPEDPYALGYIEYTDATTNYVSFEGNVDDNGARVYTPQNIGSLSSYDPIVGDRVLLLRVGHTWVILGAIEKQGITYARYAVGRSAVGIVAGAYDIPPAVPSNPWSTSSTFSDPNTWSRITILKPCHIDYTTIWSGTGGSYSEMQLRTLAQASTVQSTTPGGGLFQGIISYSGLLVAGETLDVILRNTGTATTTITYRTFVTFTDANPLVAQT